MTAWTEIITGDPRPILPLDDVENTFTILLGTRHHVLVSTAPNADVSEGDDARAEAVAGPPSSVLRPRLAAAPIEGSPTLDEVGLNDAKAAAFEWQSERSRVAWMATVWPMLDVKTGEWIPRIYGLFGSAAEVVLTSIEAAAEIEIAKRELNADISTSMHAALSRTVRFFAEGQVNNLAVFGHNAANLALRSLMLFRDFEPVGIYGIKPAVFTAKSLGKGSWVSLSPKLPDELDGAIAAVIASGAAALPAEATRLVAHLRELVQGAWLDLYEHRNDLYHGWRGEADGVTGVNFNAPGVCDRLAAGTVISVDTHPGPYVEGRANTDQTLDVARRTLDQLAGWMPRFHAAWRDVVNVAKPQP